MLKSSAKFTKKKALTIILIASIIFFLLVLTKWFIGYKNNTGLMTLDGRESFLFSLGWKIDRDSEEFKTVRLPEQFNGVMSDYNVLQKSQGFDFEKYRGKDCSQYTYKVTNYPDVKHDVYVTIYICGREVIGGDIHTASSDGFMHGIKRTPNV